MNFMRNYETYSFIDLDVRASQTFGPTSHMGSNESSILPKGKFIGSVYSISSFPIFSLMVIEAAEHVYPTRLKNSLLNTQPSSNLISRNNLVGCLCGDADVSHDVLSTNWTWTSFSFFFV